MRPKWALIVAGICLVVAASAVAYAAGRLHAPRRIQAARFELVNSEGHVVASLGLFKGTPQLSLYARKNGRGRVAVFEPGRLALEPRWPRPGEVELSRDGLVIKQTGPAPVAALITGPSGGPGLQLRGSKGSVLIGAGHLHDPRTGKYYLRPECSLALVDENGTIRFKGP